VEEVYHDLKFSNDGTLLVKLAVKEGNVVNLVKDSKVETLPVNQVKRVIWNGMCGWPYKSVTFINNSTSVTGLFTTGDKGLVTIEATDGTVYSVNIAFVKTDSSTTTVTVDKTAGSITYGDGNPVCQVTPPPPVEEVYHDLKFSNDGSLLVKLAIKDNNVVNIVKNSEVATLPVNQVKEVIWNGMCGWPYKSVIFINNATTVTGLFCTGDKGLVTIKATDGGVYSVNIAFVKTDSSTTTVTVDKTAGSITYGDGNPVCQVDPPPEEEKIYHDLKFSNDGSLVVKLAIKDGNVVNLVKDSKVETLPVTEVKTIHWNGQCGWPYRSVAFVNNATTITGLDSTGDTGLVTIEAKNGEVYPINIGFVETNGTVNESGGSVAYGDGDPKCPWE
jgi:alpha-acetolactate decarboxylase